MKHSIIHLPVFALGGLLLGCAPESELRAFIPGTYISHAEGEFSVSEDTLVIQPLNPRDAMYRIQRRSTFRRIEAQGPGSREQKKETWTGHLKEESRILTESRKGKRIRFFPDSGYLLVERRKYPKID